MKKVLPLIGLLAISMASPTLANTQGKNWGDQFFMKADANNDGIITKSEFMDHADKKFAKMDTNKDGDISKKEMSDFRTKEHAAMKARRASPAAGSDTKPDPTVRDNNPPVTSDETKTNSDENY